jgi:hypothetical protein
MYKQQWRQQNTDVVKSSTAPLQGVTESVTANVNGYWTTGRGKEIINSIQKVCITVQPICTTIARAKLCIKIDA